MSPAPSGLRVTSGLRVISGLRWLAAKLTGAEKKAKGSERVLARAQRSRRRQASPLLLGPLSRTPRSPSTRRSDLTACRSLSPRRGPRLLPPRLRPPPRYCREQSRACAVPARVVARISDAARCLALCRSCSAPRLNACPSEPPLKIGRAHV